MEEKYRMVIKKQFEECSACDQVDHYVELFPELDSRLSKFAAGIFLWNKKGEIDIDNPDDVSRVRLTLRVIDQTPGFDFFDEVFNEADIDTVCSIIGINVVSPHAEKPRQTDYSVIPITCYADARKYRDAVSWCIVISEASYDAYTANGNRFYFCGNGEWRNLPCIPGMGFPHDQFGYSLIAVEVTPDNKIASITSRWNTCASDTGGFISEEELKNILGNNYNKLFITNKIL